MNKIYLTEFICEAIKITRIQKGVSSKALSKAVGKSVSWITKVEKHEIKSISIKDAKKIKEFLGIDISRYVDNADNIDNTDNITEQLQQKRVNELLEENKRLKELLMEKWKNNEKNKFKTKIPNGYLMIEEKGAENEYPGVYISFSKDGIEYDVNKIIACIEYDNVDKEIKTVTYTEGFEEPDYIICHSNGLCKAYKKTF